MEPCGGHGRFVRRNFSREESPDDAGENVAAAACCEPLVSGRINRVAAVGVGDDRRAALVNDDVPALFRRAERDADAVRFIFGDGSAEKRPELAGVRSENARRVGFENIDQRSLSERVAVDHGRNWEEPVEARDDVAFYFADPEAAAVHNRVERLGELEDLELSGAVEVFAVARRKRFPDRFDRNAGIIHSGRKRDKNVTGRYPERAHRGEKRRAGHAVRASDDEKPRLAFVGCRRFFRKYGRFEAFSPRRGELRIRNADAVDNDAPRVLRAGKKIEPRLGAPERDGHIGPHRHCKFVVEKLAGIGVDAGRNIERDDARAGRVYRADSCAHPFIEGPVMRARAENRIDDESVSAKIRSRFDDRGAEDFSHDAAIPAIIALARDDCDFKIAPFSARGDAGFRGALHQSLGRYSAIRIDLAHFVGCDNLHVGHRHCMKILSWNVNGLRSALKKGFLDFVRDHQPDILCLQETKSSLTDIPVDLPDYEECWNHAAKKGYSGTATFCRVRPVSVTRGLGIEKHDQEGRVIAVELSDFYIVNVYVPNAKRDLARLPYRTLEWDVDLLAYLKRLEKTKPVVVCGDFNVAHKEIDLSYPAANVRSHGFTIEERGGFDALIAAGFIDAFREFDNAPCRYTWWSPFRGCRERNIGWRIDYVCVSAALRPRLKDAFILKDVTGSDHCPVGITLE